MHIAKFKKSAVGNIFNHIERDGSRNHSNTNIDKAKTCLNYSLLNDGKTAQKRYAEILQRDNLKVANKDDLNTIISSCITLPQSITDEEQSKAFFEAVFQAHCEKFGKENIVFAEVHRDETQNHLHFGIVPIVEDKSKKAKKKFKVSAKELITKDFLLSYHKDIEDRINEILPFEVSLLKTAEEKSKNAPVPMGIFKKRFEAMEDFQNEQIESALDVADAIKNRAEREAKSIIEDAKQKANDIIADASKKANDIIASAQNVYAENEQLKEENAQLKEEVAHLQWLNDAFDKIALEFMLEDKETTIALLEEVNCSDAYINDVIARANAIIQRQNAYDYDER